MTPDLLPPDESIGTLITRVVDDAKAFVAAEIALYRAKAMASVAPLKMVAILGVTAIVLVNAAVITLLVGLILTLQTLVGPGWATLIVVLGTLAIAGLLGWLAAGRIGRMSAKKADA